MKSNFLLLTALLAAFSSSSAFAGSLADQVTSLATLQSQTVSAMNTLGANFSSYTTAVSGGSLSDTQKSIKAALDSLDHKEIMSLDRLAPSSTDYIRGGSDAASDTVNKLLKAIGYSEFTPSVSNWLVVAAPVTDTDKLLDIAYSPAPDTWTITVAGSANTYIAASLPSGGIEQYKNITFVNQTSNVGDIILQYTGASPISAGDYSKVGTAVGSVIAIDSGGTSFTESTSYNLYGALNAIALLIDPNMANINSDANYSTSIAQRIGALQAQIH